MKQTEKNNLKQKIVARNRHNNLNNNNFYTRVFIITTVILLSIILYKIIFPFFTSMAWALLLAFLLYPLHMRIMDGFNGRLKKHENLSAAFLTTVTFIIFVGPITALSMEFFSQISELVQWLQETLGKQHQEQYQELSKLKFFEPIIQWLRENFGIRSYQIKNWFYQLLLLLPPFITDMSGKIFLVAVDTVFAFVIMLFMLFFFLRDGKECINILLDLVPMTSEHRKQLLTHMAAVVRSVVFGTGLTALVQGALIGIAFLITGFNSPLVFGILAALLALLPFGGTAFVWIPAVIFLAEEGQWEMTIIMMIMGIFASTIDNVLKPVFISSRGEVGTLAVFIGVLGGATAFGPIGIFLGPVILAFIIALIRFSVEVQREN